MTTIKPASTAAPQQVKEPMLNPLSLTDEQILELVYKTHVHTVESYDAVSLFNVVSTIMRRSTYSADSTVLKSSTLSEFTEEKAPSATFNPPTRLMKQISYQMINTPHDEYRIHQTTMWILDQLKSYTWEAKAVITLAAFSLEYGGFWHLAQAPTADQLGKSLAALNRVQLIERNRQAISEYNILVKSVNHAVECITELERYSTKGYDANHVPALTDALMDIPVVVYWAIATIVACASHVDVLLGDWDNKYAIILSNFSNKHSSVISKLKAHLTRIKEEIRQLEDYWWRVRVLQTPTEIVEVLKVLIFPNEIQVPQVYEGATGRRVSLEVFRQNHVLLFISGLESIRDEVRLLQSIDAGLKEDPQEVKGYWKKNFKILWVPIVDEWDIYRKAEFESLMLDMPWYVVEYFRPLAGIRLIRENLGYKNKPIIPVFNPQGRVVNPNAMHLIFVWGIDAFPFRPTDDESLTQKWNWFWGEMKKVNPSLQNLIKQEGYIFVFGGTDDQWLQQFTEAVEYIRRHEIIKKADAVIDYYHFGRDDPKIVPRFWVGIESLFASKIQKKTKDSVLEEIKSLLCLKQESPGWVLLSKGSNVKLLGRGHPMLRTATEFDSWKGKVLERAGFDVAFKEEYEARLRTSPVHCAHMQLANYPQDVMEPIHCPDFSCGRIMEIASINYKCCHGHKDEAPESSDVTIEKKPLY